MTPAVPMDVAITGSSGLIGTALARALAAGGHRVRRVVRRPPAGEGDVRWDPGAGVIDAEGLIGVDAVVHLAGEGIASRRWTDAQKRRIRQSRTKGTGLIARTVTRLEPRPAALLSASAIGYYGDRGDDEITEEDRPGDDFLARTCVEWEAAARPALDAGVRTAFLRTGIVLDPGGGALGKMLPLFKLGLGGRMGSGRQWWPWISLDDVVGAIVHLLVAEVTGPVNLTSARPATNSDLTRTLGRVLGRPTPLPVPRFGPALLLGAELAESLLYSSARVLPTRLEQSGYRFCHAELEPALRAMLDKPAG